MLSDLRFALRSLAKTPGFTFVAVLTLAVGLGVVTTLTSLVDALLFRPAPFARPHELVRINGTSPGTRAGNLSVPEIELIREGTTAFAALMPFRWVDATLSEPDRPAEGYTAIAVGGEFFPALGIPAALGRTFDTADLAANRTDVAVLSHRLWRHRFGGDPAVIGRSLRLNGSSVTVIGVMPPSFEYRPLWGQWGDFDFWLPHQFSPAQRNDHENRRHVLLARLAPSASLEAAQRELDVLGARLRRDHPQTHAGRGLHVVQLHQSVVDEASRNLTLLLLALSGAILLIACANLSSLELARGVVRSREHAIRAALGASRLQLLWPQLLRSVILSLAGGALGLLLAAYAMELVEDQVLIGGSPWFDLQLNFPVVGVSMAIALATGLVTGMAPAWQSTRADVNEALKHHTRGASGSRHHRRLGECLIVAQLGLALVLLSGTAMLFRGFHRFLAHTPGWDPAGVVFGTVVLPAARYPTADERRSFHAHLEQALRAQPGIGKASLSSLPPLYSYWITGNVSIDGGAALPAAQPLAFQVLVSNSYFDTLAIPLIEGRSFSATERAGSPPVAIVNETMARQLWAGRRAVGQRVAATVGGTTVWHEVIGVARDVDFPANSAQPETTFQLYRPLAHEPWSYLTLAVRGPGSTADLSAAMLRAVAQLDPELPVQDVSDAPQFIDRQQRNLRLIIRATNGFAVLGVGLAALGLYGVIASLVAQRRGEFGIRLALGAPPRDLLLFVLRRGLAMALLGSGLGLLGALAVGHALAAAIPRVAGFEPAVFVASAMLLVAVAGLAALLPARRVTRIDPVEALRAE